jgi:hypothetical protein
MLIADEGAHILPETRDGMEGWRGFGNPKQGSKSAVDPRQRGTETMWGVTIPVIATGRKEKKKAALFAMQCIPVDSLSDHPPSRFRFVGIPHGAPPPPLC